MPAQLPVDSKTNEIAMIPELLNLLDISGSIITIDAIGTQTAVMEKIYEQNRHFVLQVKKNQPEAYEEIHAFMDKMEEEGAKKKKGEVLNPEMRELIEKYEEISWVERTGTGKNTETCQICKECLKSEQKSKRMAACSEHWTDQAGKNTK